MKYIVPSVLVFLMAAVSGQAGTIHGKVTGAKGESVVYIDAIPGKTFPAPTQHVEMDQKGLMFMPHLLVVEKGATVDFKNDDSVEHNVFWQAISGNKSLGHNMGTWPRGQQRSFKFDNPGVVPLLCNVHPDMAAYIVVSPTPYFAETDKTGAFKIENVPNGTYKLTAWNEAGKGKTQSVQVTVSGDAEANIALK
ncbi:MAG: carboxypeptidase regulatory-like domain-containing protein [Acidobacteriota bacterium]|nr:carboxypeptidase regulatory-like domain-containing protein [Acidobacteriota bacterium]MDE3163669.1 carboxypeptidase regulatory-like domain-containing protein [Acidobacteriota bacterium]